LKLVLILDHMAKHELQTPETKMIQKYQHRLCMLFDATQSICTTRGITAFDDFTDESLPMVMLRFLNDFALDSMLMRWIHCVKRCLILDFKTTAMF